MRVLPQFPCQDCQKEGNNLHDFEQEINLQYFFLRVFPHPVLSHKNSFGWICDFSHIWNYEGWKIKSLTF